jgi:type III secretion protein U
MAEKNDSGDKTEKPTPKRLQDARKKGDVPKSKDLSSTLGLIAWIAIGVLFSAAIGERFAGLFEISLLAINQPFTVALRNVGWSAAMVFVLLTLALLLPIVAMGILSDFLQIGPIFTFEKMTPSLDKMNPVEGFKRMFNVDNMVEIIKLLIKTILLVIILWVVLKAMLPQILRLDQAQPGQFAEALKTALMRLFIFTGGVFMLVAILDTAYQRFSFMKKMRMSMRDIRQEMKDNEGDPYIKAKRRQLHQEWAQRSSVDAARKAKALVVNPTHLAVAIEYDVDTCPIPTVIGKGEDHVAKAMREAAIEAGVPIFHQVELARGLYGRVQIDELVPADFFDAVAQVILWAQEQQSDSSPDDASTGAAKPAGNAA